MAGLQLKAALDLIRRLPPAKIESSLADLCDLAPDLTDDLLSTIDQPLQLERDGSAREFLLCDYNRDGDSYRSPWTNEFVPPLADGIKPSPRLRAIEELANSVFDSYRERYYEAGVSSAYLWELEDAASQDYAACVLFRKEATGLGDRGNGDGRWDALHVFEVRVGAESCVYKLTSTIMLSIHTQDAGDVHLAGSLTRQSERDAAAPDARAHVVNMGRQLEEMELKMRDALTHVYFGKTQEVFNHVRKFQGAKIENERKELSANLAVALALREERRAASSTE